MCVCAYVYFWQQKELIIFFLFNQLDVRRKKKILKSLCYKNIPESGKLAQNLGRFEFHIERTRSTREELSGKHLCIGMQLEFVQREKLKINGEGKKS